MNRNSHPKTMAGSQDDDRLPYDLGFEIVCVACP